MKPHCTIQRLGLCRRHVILFLVVVRVLENRSEDSLGNVSQRCFYEEVKDKTQDVADDDVRGEFCREDKVVAEDPLADGPGAERQRQDVHKVRRSGELAEGHERFPGQELVYHSPVARNAG